MWFKTSVITAHSIITKVNRSSYVIYMASAPFYAEGGHHTPYRFSGKYIMFSRCAPAGAGAVVIRAYKFRMDHTLERLFHRENHLRLNSFPVKFFSRFGSSGNGIYGYLYLIHRML